MASTNFIDGVTPFQASWFNDVNSVIYNLLSSNGIVPNSIAQIRNNLGLSGMAAQSSSSIAITGGRLDNVLIGATTANAATFTNLTVKNNCAISVPIIQDFAGLTRRVTPTGGAFVREYADMVTEVKTVVVTQVAAGTSLTFLSTDGVYPGYTATGANIPAGTTVVSLTSTTVTLSASTTAAITLNTPITFSPAMGSIEVGTFFNYDILTNSRDANDIVFGSFFSDVGGVFSFINAPSGAPGSTVAYNTWSTPFKFTLPSGEFALTGTIKQNFSGLIRQVTNVGGAQVREYADITPAGGLPIVGNVEFGTFYNSSINIASGTWFGRDIQDACWVEKYSDSAPYTRESWYAVSDIAGSTPVWVRSYSRNLSTGSITLGTPTNVGSTNPLFIDLGGTFSSVAGTNLKLKLFYDGSSSWGIGASAGSLDYVVPSTAAHNFFIGVSPAVTISSTAGLQIAAGTSTFAPIKFTAGVELTAPVAGVLEYDALNFYLTPNTTIGRMVIETKKEIYSNVSTVGSGTLGAADLINGLIYRTGPGAPFTDTTDTAVNIVAFTGSVVGSNFELTYINAVAFAATIAAGTGVTLAGNTPTTIAASGVKKYIGIITSATTVTLYGI